MPCVISWSLGISLHYLLLVPLSVVLNMIRGDLSEWILDTHSQIIQLIKCLQTPQVGLFLRINLAKFVVTNTKRLNKSSGREKLLLQRYQSYNRRTFGRKSCHFFVKFQWYLKQGVFCGWNPPKGRVPLPNQMDFRKIVKGGGCHFQFKNSCCRFWEL